MSDREPGLQAERTALAWARTGAIALATSILVGRLALHARLPLLLLGAASTTVFAAAALLIRHRRLRADRSRAALPARTLLAFAVLASVSGLITLAGMLRVPA